MEVRSNFHVALHLDTFIQVSKWLIISRSVHTVLSWFSQRDASQWKSTWVTELSQGVSYQTSKVSVHLRVVKQRRQGPRWKEIVIRNSITAWGNLKVFIGLPLWHQLKIINCCFQKKRLTIYINKGLHLAGKDQWYMSMDIICFKKWTVFQKQSLMKNVSLELAW